MRWSKLKELVEDRFAPSVKGRVSLFSTRYRGAHDSEGRAAIRLDGKEILNMSCYIKNREQHHKKQIDPNQAEVNSYNVDVTSENIFEGEALRYLDSYLSLSVNQILASENPIIRALGMLDARVGKRKLRQMDIADEIELVRRLWRLRCEAEGIDIQSEVSPAPSLTSKISTNYWSRQHKLNSRLEDKPETILATSKRSRDVNTLLKLLINDAISRQELTSSTSQLIFDAFKKSDDQLQFGQAIEHLFSRTKMLGETEYLVGLLAIINDHNSWRQSLLDWKPRSHNKRKQFTSLLRHLFAKYEVPVFMDKAWLTDNQLHQNWFKHLAIGNNIRTAEGLPVTLTKKMAHYFLQAPEFYSIEAALRYAQIIALGGDRKLSDAILDTRLVTNFENDHFWQCVLQFFIRNPMLDPQWINPIVDYIWNQKFEDRIEFTEAGVAENTGPAQPNFSMHGRTANALIKQVEAWHEQLGRAKPNQELRWSKSQIKDFQFVEGQRESKNMKVWRIYELLSSALLTAEGRKLKHCVASYAKSCVTRYSSIWTMEVQTEEGSEKLVTIEVRLGDSTIRQVRGFKNRLPNKKETEIIQRWASQEGLT